MVAVKQQNNKLETCYISANYNIPIQLLINNIEDMTNLQRWLMYAGLLAIPYLALVASTSQSTTLERWKLEIRLMPFIFLVLFGLYAATVVLYRTLTFNDCEEAAKELQLEIKQARHDLTAKGFKFRD